MSHDQPGSKQGSEVAVGYGRYEEEFGIVNSVPPPTTNRIDGHEVREGDNMTTAIDTKELAPPVPMQDRQMLATGLDFTEDTEPFSAEVVTKLARPVDPAIVEVKPPNNLLFLPWIHYQAVLLDAFGPGGFKMVPTSPHRQQGKDMTWTGALFVRPPGSRKFQFIKQAVGECGMHANMSVANAAEGAQSDCLVKCCKQLGIFKELFDPSWRRWWQKEYASQHAKDVQRAARPEGTGGVAPAAPKADTPDSSSRDVTSQSGTSAPSASAPSSTASADDGEPIDELALSAIRAAAKRLKWKKDYSRIWLKDFFGLENVEALSRPQGDAALVLLQAYGTNAYPTIVAQFQAAGRIAS